MSAGGGFAGQGGQGGSSCTNSIASDPVAPRVLSQTGLYVDITSKQVGATLEAYTPTYTLWSDGVDKARWIYLPECGAIDSSDMDHWQFPVGTRAFKEFSVGGKRLETRMVHRFGPGSDDFLYATYVWRDDELEADHTPNGLPDVRGTDHDVPDVDACTRCHGPHPAGGGLPSRMLGFSAFQLSHDGPGWTMKTLSDQGRLSHPAPMGFSIPGSPTTQQALGYLHANCGNCHNDSVDGLLVPYFNTFIKTTDASVEMTGTYQTLVGQPTEQFIAAPHCLVRVTPGDPGASCVSFRMHQRDLDDPNSKAQMPPLASELVDPAGTAVVDKWISTLAPPP